MASILVVAEIHNGKIRESTFELLTFARRIGQAQGWEVRSLVAGKGVQAAAEELARQGGGEVYFAEHDLLANYSVSALQKAVGAAVAASATNLVMFSHTPIGWDVAPRVAAALDAAYVSDCFNVEEAGSLVFLRRVFNGKLDARFAPVATPIVATFQPGATAPFAGAADGKVTPLAVALSPSELRTRFVEIRKVEKTGVDLSKADIIVSGGRGLGAPEKFPEVIQPLVDALGGAMGASRPVVDAGWLPHAYQVGSSGQTVTPKLYIAVGISGAIQHLVGMKNSNYIIAINKDADAPIFEVANLGVVGDLFEIAPALTKAVNAAKGKA